MQEDVAIEMQCVLLHEKSYRKIPTCDHLITMRRWLSTNSKSRKMTLVTVFTFRWASNRLKCRMLIPYKIVTGRLLRILLWIYSNIDFSYSDGDDERKLNWIVC